MIKICHFVLFLANFAFVVNVSSLTGEEVVVLTPEGNSLTVEIEPEDSFKQVMQKIESNFNEDANYANNDTSRPFIVDFMGASAITSHTAKSKTASDYRVYNKAVTSSEKSDMRYILTSLASDSWASIISSKSSLNKAGDRIDHVHPLRFLATVFNDKELRGCIHTVRDRKLIWKNFYDGLEESLQEESNKGNMQKFTQDFANTVGINVALISGLIASNQWSTFVDTLLDNLPRSGDTTRYDM